MRHEKLAKKKGEKINLIYWVSCIFWDLNWGVRCVASRLVTRDLDRELAGEEKCIVSNCGFAGSRFSAKFSPNSQKRACSQPTANPGDVINRSEGNPYGSH